MKMEETNFAQPFLDKHFTTRALLEDEQKTFEICSMVASKVSDYKREGLCYVREDGTHCACWWECEPCCACGHNPCPSEDCDCENCVASRENMLNNPKL